MCTQTRHCLWPSEWALLRTPDVHAKSLPVPVVQPSFWGDTGSLHDDLRCVCLP